MLRAIQSFVEEWKQARAAAKFRKGYEYAYESLSSGKETVREIERHIDSAKIFNTYSEFDQGVEKAISDWTEIRAFFKQPLTLVVNQPRG